MQPETARPLSRAQGAGAAAAAAEACSAHSCSSRNKQMNTESLSWGGTGQRSPCPFCAAGGGGLLVACQPRLPNSLIYESDNKNPIRLFSLRKRSRRKKLCVTEQH